MHRDHRARARQHAGHAGGRQSAQQQKPQRAAGSRAAPVHRAQPSAHLRHFSCTRALLLPRQSPVVSRGPTTMTIKPASCKVALHALLLVPAAVHARTVQNFDFGW